jgi:hypothetical protein
MQVVKVKNVNQALPLGMSLLYEDGVLRESRAGDVIEYPGVVATVYEKPTERVLFSPERDANPFFHFIEGLWMLDGRNDVESIAHYVKRMGKFSDDSKTLHGAYGHRWRSWFGRDQLLEVINRLSLFEEDRRVVLTMWDPENDFTCMEEGAKDVPCNTHVYFKVRDGKLHMTVCCRSNDMIWGAYGANAVHMSMLQEFIANAIKKQVGTYTQISDSYHAYQDVYANLLDKIPPVDVWNFHHVYSDPYKLDTIQAYPQLLLTDHVSWLETNNQFLSTVFDHSMEPEAIKKWNYHSNPAKEDPFFVNVAEPIAVAWEHYKLYKELGIREEIQKALYALSPCLAGDWRRACIEWIERRAN